MRYRRLRNPHVQLGLVFVLLVLVPSFLLGYFSLRAVENERRASTQRLLADRAGYAEFAGRAVHRELEALEATWKALVPRRVGWETELEEIVAALAAARGQGFVGACHLLHVSGRRLYPPEAVPAPSPAAALELLDPAAAERFQELLTAAETAEFDADDPEVALLTYRALLTAARPPRLRAIAHAGIGRAHMRRAEWTEAIAEFERILTDHPEAFDLDNQPLGLQAWLQIARARQEMGEALPAAAALVGLYEDLVAHSDAIGRLQYDIFVERIEERMARLLPRPVPEAWRPLTTRYDAVRAQRKKPVGSDYFVHKLSRKLIRAALDGLAYSTPVRYLSDTVEGKPFLLAYLYLPDASGTNVAGLVGFEIDLDEMSNALLPGILQELELGEDLALALVDGEGRHVIGSAAAPGPPPVTHSLGVPFDFWSVAVSSHGAESVEARIDFRTQVYLYFVLLLLLTIGAGTLLVASGLRREARLANLKTGLVSSVSHELRTPLTSIRMFSEMLEEGGENTSPEQRAHYLRTIRRECDRLQRLIDQVLDFARSERGTRQYRLEFEEIGALVQCIAEDFRAQAEADGCRYSVDIEPDLPELRVDADAVRQMLLNLLANAVQYSETDRRVTVRAFRRGREVGLQVEDHGIGIDPAEQAHVFEDFYRGDARLSKRRGGLGLGLALVRRIAESHGGRVGVDSRRGHGSTFTIWLPVPEPESGRLQASARELRHG